MWCRQCQQDVPGVVSSDAGEYCCPRCGDAFGEPLSTPCGVAPGTTDDGAAGAHERDVCTDGGTAGCPAEPTEPAAPSLVIDIDPSNKPPPDASYDDWEMEEQLRHIERLLNSGGVIPESAGRRARLDSAHGNAAGRSRAKGTAASARREGPAKPGDGWLSRLTWITLSLGLAAFACGGVLLGWSFVTDRQDLWGIGTPIALGGQIALLIGLILQLDRLWYENRDTTARLEHVDEQLSGLLLGPGRRPLHEHAGEAVSPHLLLADLKSQLDVLAVKIGQQSG